MASTTTITHVCAVLVLVLSCVVARPSDSAEDFRESRSGPGFKGEHRSAPADPQLLNLQYYGGAEGNVLVYHPTLGLAPAQKNMEIRDEAQSTPSAGGGEGSGGGSDSDSVAVQLPPPGASVAEVRPIGVSIAGVGGVAASSPKGTAVVGPGGMALARPIATAIAGVPPDVLLGPGPGQPDPPALVGPSKQPGHKYGLMPMARNIQPYSSVPYLQQHYSQPFYLYPVAYY